MLHELISAEKPRVTRREREEYAGIKSHSTNIFRGIATKANDRLENKARVYLPTGKRVGGKRKGTSSSNGSIFSKNGRDGEKEKKKRKKRVLELAPSSRSTSFVMPTRVELKRTSDPLAAASDEQLTAAQLREKYHNNAADQVPTRPFPRARITASHLPILRCPGGASRHRRPESRRSARPHPEFSAKGGTEETGDPQTGRFAARREASGSGGKT
jgi:hypothetical protein